MKSIYQHQCDKCGKTFTGEDSFTACSDHESKDHWEIYGVFQDLYGVASAMGYGDYGELDSIIDALEANNEAAYLDNLTPLHCEGMMKGIDIVRLILRTPVEGKPFRYHVSIQSMYSTNRTAVRPHALSMGESRNTMNWWADLEEEEADYAKED